MDKLDGQIEEFIDSVDIIGIRDKIEEIQKITKGTKYEDILQLTYDAFEEFSFGIGALDAKKEGRIE